MRTMMKKWYRSRRNLVIITIVTIFCILYYVSLHGSLDREANLDVTRRESIIAYIENKLQEALKEDKGTGCEFPNLDPFAKEVTQFDKDPPVVRCPGQDWVKCYLSECRVVKELLKTATKIVCDYRDILYENDYKYTLGPWTSVTDDEVYILIKSDHVKVRCTALKTGNIFPVKWSGNAIGFRKNVDRKEPPSGREDSIDVLIFGFDSTAKNGFIRRMPNSYEFLTKELGATVLNGYNIVGDGTPAAIFPILTGKTELELPDVRKKSKSKLSLDDMPFVFYKLKEDGYRTAYFEDMPWIGTFQYRFKGFKHRPADHYLRPFYLEEFKNGRKWRNKNEKYCVGDTLTYKLMMNITEQFFELDGKHFAFTFVADITHDDFNMIAIADNDTVHFLKALKDSGKLENTLLIVMGDHGPRYANVRNTLQGKFEERMPLMAIRLPEALKRARPEVAAILQKNSRVLTTPHDIHSTVLDAMGLRRLDNDYKLKGADLPRGLSLFEPIPSNRSCSEAGVESHWCACVAWEPLPPDSVMTRRAAEAFVHYINRLADPVRLKCVPRTLTSIMWVMRRKVNKRMLLFAGNRDVDGYVGKFNSNFNHDKEYYMLKVAVGPGYGVYEASTTYLKTQDKFTFDTRDISRTNAYNDEPSCISNTHPHLNMYCYCSGYGT